MNLCIVVSIKPLTSAKLINNVHLYWKSIQECTLCLSSVSFASSCQLLFSLSRPCCFLSQAFCIAELCLAFSDEFYDWAVFKVFGKQTGEKVTLPSHYVTLYRRGHRHDLLLARTVSVSWLRRCLSFLQEQRTISISILH